MNALADYKPPHEIGQPVATLQGAIERATRKYGRPDVVLLHGRIRSVFFGENKEVRFWIGGQVYEARCGSNYATYPLRQLEPFMDAYKQRYGLRGEGTAADWLGQWADDYYDKLQARPPRYERREQLRQYERRFSTTARWTAALAHERHISLLNEMWEQWEADRPLMYPGAM